MVYWGSAIKAIYEGKTIAFLNHLIRGRDIHPISFLFRDGSWHHWVIFFYVILICLVIMPQIFRRFTNGKAVLFGVFLCLVIIVVVEVVLYVCGVGENLPLKISTILYHAD